jgi:hypothetical protein
VTLTHAEQQAIRDSIVNWLSDPHPTDLAVLARRLEALPVYADTGGALLVRPDGRVILVATDQLWNDEAKGLNETRPEWVQVAHLEAARRYQRLGFLRPRRPHAAVDCVPCSGSGSLDVADHRVRCADCNGLGWRA